MLIRKKPESVGGVQRHSSRLFESLSGFFDIDKIAWHGPEWAAPIYLPLFFYKAARNGTEIVHCDDAVTSLVGSRIKESSGKKVVATVHGLDVILPIPWYQNRLRRSLQALDKVVCVSRATADKVMERGVPDRKIEIIPNSAEIVNSLERKSEKAFSELESQTGVNLRGMTILFSLGRPLRRKGFDYFITEVFPHLPENCVYIVAGPKPVTPAWLSALKPLISRKIHRLLTLASGCDTVHDELVRFSNNPRIYYFNDISEEVRRIIFSLTDLFIMPNRTVEGDMEGFGIVALEASIRGIPVIATGIEGITDAVVDGENGFCVREGDALAMVTIIRSLLDNPESTRDFSEKARLFTERRFSASTIGSRYAALFEKLFDSNGG